MKVGRFSLSWAKLRRRKWGFIWFVVINEEKDMCGFMGGHVASFQPYLGCHFRWLGWCHQHVSLAQSWPSKLGSNSVNFY